MIYSLTEDKHKIHARNARRGDKYYCPLCGNSVILRNGVIKSAHFAHGKHVQCTDDWNYDQSEFASEWQNLFDDSQREIVLENKDRIKHMAGVVSEKTVLEILNEDLTMKEFDERNRFFCDLGYNVVWLFNLVTQYEDEMISLDGAEGKGKWSKPYKMLKKLFSDDCPYKDSVSLFAQIFEEVVDSKVQPAIIKFQEADYSGEEMLFSYGRIINAEKFLDIYETDEPVRYTKTEPVKADNEEKKPVIQEGKSILTLWKMNYRVAIFRNLKTGKCVKIFDDQAETALKSLQRKWMGYIRSEGYRVFSKKVMEVYGADKPEWIVDWFVTHQDAKY
ncbi:MAG: hypothetical protein K6E47_09920 [Lachnospiraceae bacterium]|nr:hypothetical protein [Lachnospiraceae bacterium]